ncbi:tyrosine-type recombinase/integrase [Herbaspirillum huttiense]|uniref:tyrosine-type recombinase/integrase n=1 Tax=Herbaspirillum huttiense TaxID=863372 RepID=UPI003CF3577F
MLVGKTWDGAVQRWLADNSEKRSLKSDQSNILWLNKFLSDVRLSDIDSGVVHSVRTKKIASGVSNATVNRMLALLRAILRMAVVEWAWITPAPHVRLLREPVRRVRFLSPKQAVRLLSELPVHLAAMAAFSLATGLRRGNVTGLRWGQIYMKNRIAWFDGDAMKNGNAQAIPLNGDAMRVLVSRRGAHHVFVFTYKGNKVVRVV